MINPDRLYDNIYGTLVCNSSLKKPCKILRYTLGFTETEAYVYRSQSNGRESLRIRTDIYYLDTDRINKSSKHTFIGVVAGSNSEVMIRIKAIADVLNRSNCQCHFEIYDDNFLEFIDEYPKLN